jgi:hypothetical protein
MKKSDGPSRRRKDRANVGGRLQGVFLRSERLAGGRELRVYNISELGLGVEAEPVSSPPDPNEVFPGKLLVGTTVAPVQLRLVHLGPIVAGMEFVDPSGLLRGAIQRYFEPELVGASLRPSPASTGKKRIFESSEGDRLEIQTASAGVVERFAIEVLGNSVVWETKSGLRLVQNGRSEPVPEFLLKQLVKLAKSAESIETELRSQVEAVLAGTYGIKVAR